MSLLHFQELLLDVAGEETVVIFVNRQENKIPISHSALIMSSCRSEAAGRGTPAMEKQPDCKLTYGSAKEMTSQMFMKHRGSLQSNSNQFNQPKPMSVLEKKNYSPFISTH